MIRFNIISKFNSLSLDIPGYCFDNKLHCWEYHNDWNQRFLIEECHDDPGTISITILH